MKTKRLNKRYSEIKTLAALELERDRLAYRMGLKEIEMRGHIENVKESLTPSNIWRSVWSRFDTSSFMSGWSQGMSLFSSVMRKKRKKHTCSF